MEVYGILYLEIKDLNTRYLADILTHVKRTSYNDDIMISFSNIELANNSYYNCYSHDVVQVDFRAYWGEDTMFPIRSGRVVEFMMHNFEYYFDGTGVTPMFIKNVKYNDREHPQFSSNKVAKQMPPKEYTAKKSKNRTVFVLKEGIL